jgi:phosphoglycolate phosphatase-like HAD superfamily hydrolase
MIVHFGDRPFDADWIAFDKDGTLLAFEVMWGRLAEAWVDRLTGEAGQETLRQELYHSLGYDPIQRRTKPQSPLAIATTGELQTIVAVTLFREGMPWPDALERARLAFEAGDELPLVDLVQPAGDVAGLFAQLQDAGVQVAIVTTDSRSDTEETLRLLGVDHLVDHLVCGDDGLPSKPAPHMLLAAGQGLGQDPGRCAVVGDTLGDLRMAQQAGAGLKVAVLTGAGDPTLLTEHADVVLESIDGIWLEAG